MSAAVQPGLTQARSPVRWAVCAFLFAATTINYMDRSVLALIEPMLHLPFMGWLPGVAAPLQAAYHLNYGHIVECFQIAYGAGFLLGAPFIDRLGTRLGYAFAILVWALSSLGHGLVRSVAGFAIARALLGLGESGNFPAALKANAEWFPAEERSLATGLLNSGSNAAFFLAPALVPLLTAWRGWRAAFFVTGCFGLIWLVCWLLFPYNRLRSRLGIQPSDGPANRPARLPYGALFRTRRLYAFALGKGLTDPIWYFYLFYLPMFLNDNYGLSGRAAYWPLVIVYVSSSFGSILGGALPGWAMRRGWTLNRSRKSAMLLMAVCVLPILLVPHTLRLLPGNPWPAVALFALAAAAHQGWSANIFSTATDLFPSTSVSTVVGLGGAFGSITGAGFTWLVSRVLAVHPEVIFFTAASVYLLALAIFQVLAPRLGPSPIGVQA